MSKHSIYVVDDKPVFSACLASLLRTKIECSVREFHSVKDLNDDLKVRSLPDLIIMDIRMPEVNGVQATQQLCNEYPDLKILALSIFDSDLVIANILEAGAVSFVAKSEHIHVLLEAIKQTLDTGFYYTNQVLRIITESIIDERKTTSTFDTGFLTDREREILVQICLQHKNKEIADKLFISERTVEGHRANLMLKTDSRTPMGLIMFALKQKIVDLDYLEIHSNSPP